MDQGNFIKLRKDYYAYKNDSFVNKVKESVFGIIYVLLNDQSEGEGGFLDTILEFIEFLEFLAFPFHEKLKDVWNNDTIIDKMNIIFDKLSIVNYLEGSPAFLYLTVYYLSMFSITLVLLDIGYVSYSFNRKYFTVTWPLYLLKNVTKIFLTGLFNPLLELNLSILICEKDDESKEYILTTTKHVKCYNTTYFIHSVIGMIITICFTTICFFVALTLFENSEKTGGEGAKENSRADFVNICSKILSTVVSSFFVNKNYQWLLVTIHFSCSAFQFSKLYFDRPYFDFKQQQLLILYNGTYLWTTTMLLICKIFEKYHFKTGFYIWGFGIPFVGVFIYRKSYDVSRVLSKDINLCKSSSELQRHLRYLLTISEHSNQRDRENMILQGYIYNHSCQDANCSLCQLKERNSSNNEIVKKYLYQYIENNYEKGVSKFPNSTSLRVAFAMFLSEWKEDKALAYQQLNFAEKYNAFFDEAFIIYRYKKMILEENEKLLNNQNFLHNEKQIQENEELDVVTSIAYDSHFRLCLYNIKKSAELYINFWEKIINGTGQDLSVLNELAMDINSSNKNIEIHWKNMCDIKPNDPKAFKMYGEYVKNVLNDVDRGNELLAIFYEKSDKKPNSIGYLNFEIDEEYILLSKEGNAFIICSNEDDDFGKIIKCSKTTTKFLGYTEKEIMQNENIKNLFVECYNKIFLHYVQIELEKNNDSTIHPKKYLLFVRHKSNKPKAVYIHFKKYNGKYFSKKCFVCIFNYDIEKRENLKKFIKKSYFVVDQDFKMKYITEEAIELANILKRKIPDDLGNFYNIFPEFEFDIGEEQNENPKKENEENEDEIWDDLPSIHSQKQFSSLNEKIGCKAEIGILEFYQNDEGKLFIIKLEYMPLEKVKKTNNILNRNINIKPTFIYPKFNLMKKQIDIEDEEEEINENNKVEKLYEFSNNEKPISLNLFKNNYIEESYSSSFQFNDYSKDLSNGSFDDEYYSDEIKDDVLPLTRTDQNDSEFYLRNKQNLENLTSEEFKKKLESLKNYGKIVKKFFIIKIGKNEVQNVDNYIPKVTEVVRDKKNSLTIKDSISLNDSSSIEKTVNIPSVGQKNHVFTVVKFLTYISILALIIFLTCSILNYYFDETFLNRKIIHFEVLSIFFDSIQYFHNSQRIIRRIIFSLNENYTCYQGTQSEFIKESLYEINQYITYLGEIHDNITIKSKKLLGSQKKLFQEKNVPFMSTFTGENIPDSINYTYLYSFRMQTNLLTSIIPLNSSEFSYDNNFIYEYLYNNLNDFLMVSINNINNFYQISQNIVTNEITFDCVSCFFMLVIDIVCIIFLYKLIAFIEIERTKVLKSFYHIPKIYLRNLSERVKNFLQKLENSGMEELQNINGNNSLKSEESSLNSINNDSEKTNLKENQKINYTTISDTESSNKGNIYLRNAIFTIIFFVAYYSISLITNTVITLNIKTLNTDFYYNSYDYVNATIMLNIILEKFIQHDILVFKEKSLDILNTTFEQYSKLHIEISEADSDSYSIFSNELIKTLNLLKFGDICQNSQIKEQIDDCDTELNAISNFGGNIMIAEFRENLKIALDNDIIYKNITDLNSYILILNTYPYQALTILIGKFLKVYLNYWKKKLYDFIINYLNNQINLNLIFLVIHDILIPVLYIIFWIPFLFSLQDSIVQTQKMIDVIPEEIISKIGFNEND